VRPERAGPSPREHRRTRALTSRLLALGLLASQLTAGQVRAEPSAADIKTARRLFSEAEELRASGDCKEAASRLRQAIAIKETPGLRFHLAYCEEHTGALLSARSDYARAAELVAGGVSAPDVESLLDPALKALAERLPTVQVRLPAYASDARVQLDGRDLLATSLGTPLALDPGAHTVLAEAAGYDRFLVEFSVGEGEDRVVDVAFRRSSLSTTSAPSPSPLSAEVQTDGGAFGAREAVLIGEAALALAGVGVGVAFRFKRASADDDARKLDLQLGDSRGACIGAVGAVAADCSALRSKVSDRDQAANVSTGAFIGAGVFAAAAVATFVLWPKHRPAERSVALVPAPGGAVVYGTF
jgi:hypothetical protein